MSRTIPSVRRTLLASLLSLSAWLLPGCNAEAEEGRVAQAQGSDAHAGHDHAGHDHAGHDHAAMDAGSTAVGEAVAVLQPIGGSGVSGTVHLRSRNGTIEVTGELRGLSEGDHGFHVHEFGDLTDTRAGQSAGSHFDPTGMPHGRQDADQRHVGDLGNITADASGTARIDIRDTKLAFGGAHSVLGRALVVHEKADQFTQPVGDAGGRVAFGVIGVAKPGQ